MPCNRNTAVKENTSTSIFIHMYKKNGRNVNEIKITKNHPRKSQIPATLDCNQENDSRSILTQSSGRVVPRHSAESNLLVNMFLKRQNGRNVNEIKITKNHPRKNQIPPTLDCNVENDSRSILTQSSDRIVPAESNLLINTFLKRQNSKMNKRSMMPNQRHNQDNSGISLVVENRDSLTTDAFRENDEASIGNFAKATHRYGKWPNSPKKPRIEMESDLSIRDDASVSPEASEVKAVKKDYVDGVLQTTLMATVVDSENEHCYETFQPIIVDTNLIRSESHQENGEVLEEMSGTHFRSHTTSFGEIGKTNNEMNETPPQNRKRNCETDCESNDLLSKEDITSEDSVGEIEKPYYETNGTPTQKCKRMCKAENQCDDLVSREVLDSSEDSLSQNTGLNKSFFEKTYLTDTFNTDEKMKDKNEDKEPEIVFKPLEFHTSNPIFVEMDVKRIKSESDYITFEPKSTKKCINDNNTANVQNNDLKADYFNADKDHTELKLENNSVSQQIDAETKNQTSYFETSISLESSEIQAAMYEVAYDVQTLMPISDDIENKQRHEICQPVVMSTYIRPESLSKNLQILEEKYGIQDEDSEASSNKIENLNDENNKTPTENCKRRYEADTQRGDVLARNISFQDSLVQITGLDNCAPRKKILIEICDVDEEIKVENEDQEAEIVSELSECQSSDLEVQKTDAKYINSGSHQMKSELESVEKFISSANNANIQNNELKVDCATKDENPPELKIESTLSQHVTEVNCRRSQRLKRKISKISTAN